MRQKLLTYRRRNKPMAFPAIDKGRLRQDNAYKSRIRDTTVAGTHFAAIPFHPSRGYFESSPAVVDYYSDPKRVGSKDIQRRPIAMHFDTIPGDRRASTRIPSRLVRPSPAAKS
jgi:hypothetical protein